MSLHLRLLVAGAVAASALVPATAFAFLGDGPGGCADFGGLVSLVAQNPELAGSDHLGEHISQYTLLGPGVLAAGIELDHEQFCGS